ncbi:MAG: trigger factor [Armatimonadetes bacterium]|nr:trigger factor [Armatimonadota bacterium]
MQSNGIQLNSVSVEKGEGGLVSLTVEVAPQSVQTARERVIKEFSKRLKVPGFRPGSIPAGIVRRNVGDEAIAQEVSEQLVPAAYQAAIEQEKVQPLERAEVDDVSFDAFNGEQPLTFVARVIVRPEITVGSTEGLTATKRTIVITDEDVEQALQRMREERAYLVNAPERGAEEGDVLFADVQVYIDGAPRAEEPAKLRGFVLGQSGFVPPIDEHLIGMTLDETKKFPVTYPEDFQDQELAGKEAEFEVKVTAIKNRVVPELTDEFAQISGAENVEDLRAKLGDYLGAVGEREARRETREQLVKSVVDTSTLEVPTALIDIRLGERLQGIQQELAQNGATTEQYLQSINSTQEQLEADLREELGNELKTELVLDEIAAQQQIPVSMEEVEQHYLLMAQVMEQPVEQLVQNVPVANVRTSILQRKAIDLLVEKSTITDEQGNPVSMDVAAMEDEADEALGEVDAEALAELEAEEMGADSEFLDEAENDASADDEAPQASAGTAPAL